MQNIKPDRVKRTTAESRATGQGAGRQTPRRAIDCGAAASDDAARAREEARGDARHGYITSRGIYAEQAQAI